MLTACNGILDDIYDEPATPAAGDIYIDASDWTQWHYIDLHALKEATDKGEKPEQVYTTYDIPLEKTDSYDEDKTGIILYARARARFFKTGCEGVGDWCKYLIHC